MLAVAAKRAGAALAGDLATQAVAGLELSGAAEVALPTAASLASPSAGHLRMLLNGAAGVGETRATVTKMAAISRQGVPGVAPLAFLAASGVDPAGANRGELGVCSGAFLS